MFYHTQKKTRFIIANIDIDLLNRLTKGIWDSGYEFYPGYVYDKNHNFWKDGYPEGLATATYNSPGIKSTAESLRTARGFYTKDSDQNSWGNPSISGDSTWSLTSSDLIQTNLDTLISMIKACQRRNIILIGVITPQNPRYKETGSFGIYGFLRSQARELIQKLENLHDIYPNFILMDENKMGDHDYTGDMAMNNDHLATKGAEQLTNRLDSLLRTLDIDLTP